MINCVMWVEIVNVHTEKWVDLDNYEYEEDFKVEEKFKERMV